MSTDALSPTQFGAASTAGAVTSAAPMKSPEVEEPRYNPPSAAPLPYSAQTDSTAKLAAAWRKPPGAPLPLSAQTDSSLFNPFNT